MSVHHSTSTTNISDTFYWIISFTPATESAGFQICLQSALQTPSILAVSLELITLPTVLNTILSNEESEKSICISTYLRTIQTMIMCNVQVHINGMVVLNHIFWMHLSVLTFSFQVGLHGVRGYCGVISRVCTVRTIGKYRINDSTELMAVFMKALCL